MRTNYKQSIADWTFAWPWEHLKCWVGSAGIESFSHYKGGLLVAVKGKARDKGSDIRILIAGDEQNNPNLILRLEFLTDCFFSMSIKVLIGIGDLLRFPLLLRTLILDPLYLVELTFDPTLSDSLGLRLVLDDCLLAALRSLELLVLLFVRVCYSWHC